MVTRKINETTYELKLPASMKMRPVFNEWVLTPYKEDPNRKDETQDPIIIDGQEEYEVETIINKQPKSHRLELLVRWKGYSPEHDSWEPLDNLTDATIKAEEYYEQQDLGIHPKRQLITKWLVKYNNPTIIPK